MEDTTLKRRLLTLGAVACFLLAVGIMAYPIVSSFVNEKYRSEIRTSYEAQLEQADTETLDILWKAAEAYNQTLSSGVTLFNKETIELASENYVNQLNPTGNGIMGYVEVPKIGVNLPVLHGTETDTLDQGIGHLIGSSLPVGGESSHVVLTGHSGMASQRMFTDLHEMAEGDVFYLHILDRTLAYKVTHIFKVKPYDTFYLSIAKGVDLCTLVTCTPVGINSHRLLVRGERIPYEQAQVVEEETSVQEEKPASSWMRQYKIGILFGVVFVGLLGVSVFVFRCWYPGWARRCWRGKYVR